MRLRDSDGSGDEIWDASAGHGEENKVIEHGDPNLSGEERGIGIDLTGDMSDDLPHAFLLQSRLRQALDNSTPAPHRPPKTFRRGDAERAGVSRGDYSIPYIPNIPRSFPPLLRMRPRGSDGSGDEANGDIFGDSGLDEVIDNGDTDPCGAAGGDGGVHLWR